MKIYEPSPNYKQPRPNPSLQTYAENFIEHCLETSYCVPTTGRVQSCLPVVPMSSCLRDVSPYPTFAAYRSSAILSSCRPDRRPLRDVSPYPTFAAYRSSAILSSCRPAYVTCRPPLHSLPTGRVQSCLPVVLSSCLRDVSPYNTFAAYRSSAILSSCRPVVLPT